jgi:hypothetical protein
MFFGRSLKCWICFAITASKRMYCPRECIDIKYLELLEKMNG